MDTVKAINANKLVLQFDGVHHMHLGDVIATMYQTGLDMMSKYKETLLGSLAINLLACYYINSRYTNLVAGHFL
jgi:L-serine dehydratase